MDTKFLTPALIIILIGVVVFFSLKTFKKSPASVNIGTSRISVEIADSESEIEQGLSGRESLAEGQGMLFILPQKRTATFWMKDMKFPLDIIWISEGRVVGIEENASPPTQNNIPRFESPEPVTHVLEVNAGWSKETGIKLNDSVTIEL